MKKVWILEKFETHDEMVEYLNDLKETLESGKANADEKTVVAFEKLIVKREEIIKEYPDGRWYGFEGKIIYRQFCDVAKAAIRRNPKAKFRVVEGEIEDNAKYWPGYKVTKVNDGVYRYLMATK